MSSTTVRFVDTNILLYAISRDAGEAAKARRANEILAAGDVGLSVQVFQEFYVQSTRRSRPDPISHEQAAGLIESWRRFPVQEITIDVMVAALATCRRFGISYWDAAIVEACRSLGSALVLSEDLDTGTDYDGVRVENPFLAAT
jgi:predicted nucleic acid-binding protein